MAVGWEVEACMEENQRLKERNRLLNDEARELSLLLREHEQALEKVLEKFRAQTLSVQQSLAQLKLQHLQALTKQQQQTTHLEQELIKNKQKMLHFAGLLRQTLGCALSEPEQNSQLEQLTLENQILREIISTRDQVNALPLDAARSCDTTSLSLPPMSRRRSTLPSDVASPTSITDMLLPDPATEGNLPPLLYSDQIRPDLRIDYSGNIGRNPREYSGFGRTGALGDCLA